MGRSTACCFDTASYALQATPSLLSHRGGIKPVLIIPAAVSVALI